LLLRHVFASLTVKAFLTTIAIVIAGLPL